MADDLGYGDLGCYGSMLNKTPRLDRMAEEGLRCTDFYMGAPVCSPSRAGLMTGCYPKRVGLDSGVEWGVLLPADPIGLSPDEITVAGLLKETGYATGIIGKWHLGDQPPFLPTRHGFDSWFGLPYSNDHYMGRKKELLPENYAERFRKHGHNPLPLMEKEEIIELEPDQSSLTARYTDKAVSFISEHKDEPFFLYLAHMYVHTPLFPPKEFLEKTENGEYGAEVECLDWSTGVILDVLKELGLDEDTLVIFTSDNGAACRQGSNAPLRGGKASTWEGGMREPCIMRWPGTIPEGSVSGEVISSIDFLPTFTGFAEGKVPQDRIIDGHDISDIICGKEAAGSPWEAYFYYGSGNHTLEAVRSGPWKLRLIDNELFNLEKDISENSNLYDQYPDIVNRLTGYAQQCRKDIGDARTGTEGENCRPAGRVENPKPLATRDQADARIRAMYDLDDIPG